MTLPIGYTIEEFEIQGILGRGGFGITYIALDKNLNKKVVIKEFFPKAFATREDSSLSLGKIEEEFNEEKKRLYLKQYQHFLKKFKSEAQIMAELEHPNIVKVIRYFEANNTCYFVMTYIEGETLKEYVKQVGSLNQEEIMEIIVPILNGLKSVHKADFLHRDIAPDNIILTKDKKKPMLLDFGAAKIKNTNDDTDITFGIAKNGYSAPEQHTAESSQHTTALDIYSIGAVIVFMLTGEVPPEATKRLTYSNKGEDPLDELLQKYHARCTQGFIKAIQRAMSLNEKSRFQNIEEFKKALSTQRVSLKRYVIKEKKRLTQEEIVSIVNSLLDQLELLHSKNKIHANLSADTIYINHEKSIELGRPITYNPSDGKSLTSIFNIGYSAPEQHTTDNQCSKVTDIYSVGAILFFLITTEQPTEATKRQIEIYNGKKDSIKSKLEKNRNKYDDHLLQVVLKAMKLNMNERFQDITPLRNKLNKSESGEDKPSLPIKKLMTIGLGILVGAIAFWYLSNGDHSIPPQRDKNSTKDINVSKQTIVKPSEKNSSKEDSNPEPNINEVVDFIK